MSLISLFSSALSALYSSFFVSYCVHLSCLVSLVRKIGLLHFQPHIGYIDAWPSSRVTFVTILVLFTFVSGRNAQCCILVPVLSNRIGFWFNLMLARVRICSSRLGISSRISLLALVRLKNSLKVSTFQSSTCVDHLGMAQGSRGS